MIEFGPIGRFEQIQIVSATQLLAQSFPQSLISDDFLSRKQAETYQESFYIMGFDDARKENVITFAAMQLIPPGQVSKLLGSHEVLPLTELTLFASAKKKSRNFSPVLDFVFGPGLTEYEHFLRERGLLGERGDMHYLVNFREDGLFLLQSAKNRLSRSNIAWHLNDPNDRLTKRLVFASSLSIIIHLDTNSKKVMMTEYTGEPREVALADGSFPSRRGQRRFGFFPSQHAEELLNLLGKELGSDSLLRLYAAKDQNGSYEIFCIVENGDGRLLQQLSTKAYQILRNHGLPPDEQLARYPANYRLLFYR